MLPQNNEQQYKNQQLYISIKGMRIVVYERHCSRKYYFCMKQKGKKKTKSFVLFVGYSSLICVLNEVNSFLWWHRSQTLETYSKWKCLRFAVVNCSMQWPVFKDDEIKVIIFIQTTNQPLDISSEKCIHIDWIRKIRKLRNRQSKKRNHVCMLL